jgi:tRNA dimethylallyltransferase
MEIYLITGSPMSALLKQQTQHALSYEVTSIALVPSERSVLHQRIATRFEQMLKDGLLDELRGLREKYPLHRDMTSMRCVGYRQSWEFLEGEIGEGELLEKGIAATRQLAKRQLTWLRSMPDNVEIDCLSDDLFRRVNDTLRAAVAGQVRTPSS